MSVKFIKVRSNTNVPADRKALDILKGIDGQNAFIKNAILSYSGKGKEDIIAEKSYHCLQRNCKTHRLLQTRPPCKPQIPGMKQIWISPMLFLTVYKVTVILAPIFTENSKE